MKHNLYTLYKNAWFKAKALYRELISSKLFGRNLLYIGGIMMLFFTVFALTTYKQSRTILFEEFSSSCKYQLEITADAVDSHITDMRYVIATLDQNSIVKAFFSRKRPDSLYSDYQARLKELLQSYSYSFSSIDSIYLYSELSNTIITANTVTSFSSFADRNWADYFSDADSSSDILIFPRSKNGNYPYLLCIMKPLTINGHRAAIVLNLNLSKVAYLTRADANPYQDIFLISDDLDVLYSYNQRSLLESLGSFEKLQTNYQTTRTIAQVFNDGSDHYVYAQVHSSNNPWYYATVTELDAYTDQLSNNTTFLTVLFMLLFLAALGISIMFSIRSVRPIHELMVLMDGSVQLGQDTNNNEVDYVSSKIISFTKQNKELSAELARQLNLLNESQLLALQSQINPHFLFNTLNMIYTCECEELGYQHELPGITLSLSRLLRYAFQSTDMVSLDTELEFTKIYLELMRRRYSNRFTVQYDIASEALTTQVPKLFIQPIVENAIFHGLVDSHKSDQTLSLSIRVSGEKCIVTIADSGTGMDTSALEQLRNIAGEKLPTGTGIGVKNVVTRMKLLYADQFSMDISSELGVGTTFVLSFPIH